MAKPSRWRLGVLVKPVEPRNPSVELHRPDPQPGLAHEPLHALAAHPLPGRDERPVHSRTAIRPRLCSNSPRIVPTKGPAPEN
jgi:hypothetical protein